MENNYQGTEDWQIARENDIRQVDVYIASLPRQLHVVETVKSILANKETKSITITANKYTDELFKELQAQLINVNIITQVPIYLYRGDNLKRSNEKLKHVGKGTGKYISFVDDDLLLAPTHFEYLIQGCEKYNAYVSLHGMIMGSRPLRSFYGERHVFRGLKTVLQDVQVDIASNCGCLWKREFFSQDFLNKIYDKVNHISMDDIWMGYFCHKKNIPRYVLAHQEGFMKHKVQYAEDEYVFDLHTKQLGVTDKVQTDFVNAYWDAK